MAFVRVARKIGPFASGVFARPNGASVTYDPAAVLIFAGFTAPPTDARRTLINACVLALKAGGIWNLLDILYALAAADGQAARINWKNPGTFTATAVNSPVFTADRGFAGDGSTSYVDTVWSPATNGVNFTRNSASYGGWQTTEANAAQPLLGTGASGANQLFARSGGVAAGRINQTAGSVTGTVSSSIGWTDVVRPSAGSQSIAQNGVSVGTGVLASVAVPNESFTILKATAAFSAQQAAAAFVGGALNSTQRLALYNAMLAYMQGVGAA